MSINKSFIRILTAVALTAVLGAGVVSVSAEPDEETVGDDTYTDQETYDEPDTYEETDDTGDDYTEDDTGDDTEDPGEGDTGDDTGYEDGDDEGTSDDTDYGSDDDTGDDYSDSDDEDDYSEDDYSEDYEETYDYDYEEDQPWEYYTTEDDDDDGYYYEYDDTDEVNVPETDTSALDNSAAEYSDNDVLTSEDWENLKKQGSDSSESSQTSSFSLNVAQTSGKEFEAISKLKEESVQGNDDWIYLAWGIALISVAAVTVTVIIVTTVVSKKKLKKAALAHGTQNINPDSMYGAPAKSKTSENAGKKAKKKQKGTIVNSKTDTSEIDIGRASEKPRKKR